MEDTFGDITEEAKGLKPFGLDEAEDLTACADCVAYGDCAILAYVNKLSLRRDAKKLDHEFRCNIFIEKGEE